MRRRTWQLAVIFLGLICVAGVAGAAPARPAVAQTVCTADVRSVMNPISGPPGTRVQLSWNFGAPGPLISVSWDDQALLNGVPQPQIDDCFRGVEIVVPADATPGTHRVNVDCAFCLVAFSYGSFTFTVTAATATPTASAATPTAGATRTATALPTATPTAARPPDGPPPTATRQVPPGPPRTGAGGSHATGTWSWLATGAALLLAGTALGVASRRRGR